MLIELEPKANKEEIGYARILGYAPPGKVALPSKYAYARYKGDELVTFRGNYAYSTVLDSRWSDFVYNSGLDHMHGESYVHFANKIGQDQAIIISRPKIETTSYLIAIVFLALVCFFSLLLLNLSDSSLSHRYTAVLVATKLYDYIILCNIDKHTIETTCCKYAIANFHRS